MDILYLLIPLSVVLVLLIGGAFWWALRDGQFDDLDAAGYRILMDDEGDNRANALDPHQGQGSHAK